MANPAAQARAQAQSIWDGATVNGRGPGWIRHAHPTDPNRFMVDSQVGSVMHLPDLSEADSDFIATAAPEDQPYQYRTTNAHMEVLFSPGNDELNTPDIIQWRNRATGETVGLTFEDLEYENDIGGLELVASPAQISPDASPVGGDIVDYTDGYGSGFDLRLFADLVRMRKELRFERASLPTPTIANVEWLRLNIRFNVSNNVDIFIDGVQWGEGNSPDTETANNVEFRDSGGAVLWTFRSPMVENETDPEATEPTVTTWYRKQGPNLRVQVYVPYAWLMAQAGTDVIMIDPTVEDQVGASDEDAHEKANDTTFTVDSTHICSSNTLSSGQYTAESIHVLTGPASGDTVDVAYLVVYARPGVGTINVDIVGEDVDSAADFTTTADVINRTQTTASVDWDTSLNSHSVSTQSPGFTAVVQEIFDRGGWSSGNNIGIMLRGKSDRNVGTQLESYDQTAGEAPLLHIEYTSGGGAATGFMTTNTGYWGP